MDNFVGVPGLPLDDHTEHSDDDQPAEPQFGLIDIVEAFTALRHEYRTQAKETRQLADQLEESTRRIESLQEKLPDDTSSVRAAAGDDSSASLAKTLIEFDIQLTRAVDTVVVSHRLQRSRQLERDQAVQLSIARLSRTARWFARPLINALRQNPADAPDEPSTVAEGLSILLAKVREALRSHGIQRIETKAQPFDGATMNSIGVIESAEVPAGHVVQQLSPAYVKDGKVLRYADVRVAS